MTGTSFKIPVNWIGTTMLQATANYNVKETTACYGRFRFYFTFFRYRFCWTRRHNSLHSPFC